MTKRSLAPLVFIPIATYLAVMVALALFVVHPPAIGWVGLAVSSIIAIAIGAVGLELFQRSRTNAARHHPREGAVHRLLVICDTDIEPDQVSSAVRLRLLGHPGEVRVVAPVMVSPLHFLTDDELPERDLAAERLATTLLDLNAVGVPAHGSVGTDDPLASVSDALVGFPADEILLIGRLDWARGWLDANFEDRARDAYDLPVTTVYGTTAARRDRPVTV